MNDENRAAAILTYLLPGLGWLYVFMFHRHDKLALFHTRQSMVIVGLAVGSVLAWAIVGWLMVLVPLIGPPLAVVLFALVVALYLALLFIWVMGMIHASQARQQPLPLVSRWAERLPILD